ncbi:hypothetical protein ABFX02_04G082600 [Erythranthe guttata]
MGFEKMRSSNSGGTRVGRKVRVAVGNTGVDKAHRKMRAATGLLKVSIDVDTTLDSNKKKKGGKKLRSGDEKSGETRTKGKIDFKTKSRNEVRNGDEKSGTKEGKRDFKAKSRNEGFGTVIDGNSSGNNKRKRVYADNDNPSVVVEGGKRFDGSDRNSSSKSRNTTVGSFVDKRKKLSRGDNDRREFKDSSRDRLLRGSSDKFRGSSDLGDGKSRRVRENGLENGVSKTGDKRRAPLLATKTYVNRRKDSVGSVEKPRKKNDASRKGSGANSDSTEELRMKTKRVIRIDPRDISNKRIDDEIDINGNSQEKIDVPDKTGVEMSKNAQFRAIQPSSSILSFVEDNLLGRRRDIEFRRAGYNIELPAPLDNIPSSTGPERERVEVPEFRNKLEFFAAAKVSSSFPPPDLSEIAFAGRSNVGKSSLLNALTRQWGVVRTSDKPGLTQTINFFKLGSKLCLVDLPGYGFAFAKEEVKEAWEELVKEYVSTRVGLKRVCLLVDTKWGLKPRDHELIDLMERSETKYQIVLTKTDSVFPIDVARRAMQIEENLKAKKSAVQPLMMVSSKTGAGIRSLRTVLSNVARLVRR